MLAVITAKGLRAAIEIWVIGIWSAVVIKHSTTGICSSRTHAVHKKRGRGTFDIGSPSSIGILVIGVKTEC